MKKLSVFLLLLAALGLVSAVDRVVVLEDAYQED